MDQYTKPGTGTHELTAVPPLKVHPPHRWTLTSYFRPSEIPGMPSNTRWRKSVWTSLLHQDLRNVADRVTETETRVTSVENQLTTLKAQVSKLLKMTAFLEEWAEDAENHSRRSNLHFVSIPIGENGFRTGYHSTSYRTTSWWRGLKCHPPGPFAARLSPGSSTIQTALPF